MNTLLRQTARIGSASKAYKPLSLSRGYSTEAPKAVGAVRGGLLGFLLGVTISGGVGYYYLLEEYNTASATLLSSVQDLQASTEKVRDYARRIESIDRDLSKLKETTATTQQLQDLRVELKKLYDALNIEHLELKTHVWGLEQDISPKTK
ncbi:unnamed protein product [Umbelopsis ramanniana]